MEIYHNKEQRSLFVFFFFLRIFWKLHNQSNLQMIPLLEERGMRIMVVEYINKYDAWECETEVEMYTTPSTDTLGELEKEKANATNDYFL